MPTLTEKITIASPLEKVWPLLADPETVASDQSGTAYSYTGTLDNETSYYWQVTAWKNGIMLSQSNIGTFSTAPEEIIVEPPAPGPAPVINIPGTTQIAPNWIYAIIGIGAGLAAAVIVLIVKSRSPKS